MAGIFQNTIATGRDDPDRSDLDFLLEFEPIQTGAMRTPISTSSRDSKRCSVGQWISSSRPPSGTATSANPSTEPRRSCMRLETKKYLLDIQQAALLASAFVAGRTFADYQETAMLRAAVERQCEIIGAGMS